MFHWGQDQSDLQKQVADHEVRIKVVERENETTKAIRESRQSRREFWIVKLMPTISGVTITILALNAVFHWF